MSNNINYVKGFTKANFKNLLLYETGVKPIKIKDDLINDTFIIYVDKSLVISERAKEKILYFEEFFEVKITLI